MLVESNMATTSMLAPWNPYHPQIEIDSRPIQVELLAQAHSGVQSNDDIRQSLHPFRSDVQHLHQRAIFFRCEPTHPPSRLQSVFEQLGGVSCDLLVLNSEPKDE